MKQPIVISYAGPMQEINDASPVDGAGALFGFFGILAQVRAQMGQEKVVELVGVQLAKLFGEKAEQPLAILYKDWANDADTAVPVDASPFKNYASYGQPPAAGAWEGKAVFAGTETNAQYSGHLEGALRSVEEAVRTVLGSGQ